MRKSKVDIENLAQEINQGKPKMNWLRVKSGQYEYFSIDGSPNGIYFIKHGIRHTYAMHKGEWKEVSVYLLLEELMLRFEKLWKEKKINFDDYKEKAIKEAEKAESPNFDEED